VQKKKLKTDEAARRAAAILEAHFATLSKERETKARKELHALAIAVSRRARGKLHNLGEARRVILQPVLA
jgi:hypothetical protein